MDSDCLIFMKNLLTILFLTAAITCFAGVLPIQQNPYTTGTTGQADARVAAISATNIPFATPAQTATGTSTTLAVNPYDLAQTILSTNDFITMLNALYAPIGSTGSTNSSGVVFTNIQFQFTNRLDGGGYPVFYTNHWASYIQIQGLVATLTGNDYNNAGLVSYGVIGRWSKSNSVQAAAITGGTINIDTLPTFGVYTNEVFWFGAPNGAYGVIQYAGEIQWVIGGGSGGGSTTVTSNSIAAIGTLGNNISGSAATANTLTAGSSVTNAASISSISFSLLNTNVINVTGSGYTPINSGNPYSYASSLCYTNFYNTLALTNLGSYWGIVKLFGTHSGVLATNATLAGIYQSATNNPATVGSPVVSYQSLSLLTSTNGGYDGSTLTNLNLSNISANVVVISNAVGLPLTIIGTGGRYVYFDSAGGMFGNGYWDLAGVAHNGNIGGMLNLAQDTPLGYAAELGSPDYTPLTFWGPCTIGAGGGNGFTNVWWIEGQPMLTIGPAAPNRNYGTFGFSQASGGLFTLSDYGFMHEYSPNARMFMMRSYPNGQADLATSTNSAGTFVMDNSNGVFGLGAIDMTGVFLGGPALVIQSNGTATFTGNGSGLTNVPSSSVTVDTTMSSTQTVNPVTGQTNYLLAVTNVPVKASWSILTNNLVNGVQYSNSLAQRAVVEGRYVSTMGNPAFGGYSFISISGGRDGSMQTNEVQVKGSSSAVVKIGVSRHINAGEVFQFVDDTPSGSGYLTNCDVIY